MDLVRKRRIRLTQVIQPKPGNLRIRGILLAEENVLETKLNKSVIEVFFGL